MTLRIKKSASDQGTVVFTLSGRIETIHVAELQKLFDLEDFDVVLDMHDVQLVDRATVAFLEQCETNGVKLDRCPAYVREWIERERMAK
jgi:hypothetical protein